MSKLDEARLIINDVDKKMADLFKERMKAAKMVAEYKKENGLPILDAKREEAVVNKNSEYIQDNEILNYYQEFIKNTMAVSRKYQHKLINGARVAYSGVEGAFAYIAASRVFPDGELISYDSFNSAYDAVVKGECDYCVLPIENSYAGEVGQVTDLMFNGPLSITGVYSLPIVHNLLGTPDALITDIKKVVSHPQALSQCANYIEDHGFKQENMVNTAVAAKYVASTNDKTIGAIASRDTAKLYGLKVLDHDINESSSNTTRFAVFTKYPTNSKTDDTFILLFTVTNTAGSLAKAIDIIGKWGYNMKSLRSRPMKSLAWEYYFYIEASGNPHTIEGEKMFEELKSVCDRIKVVGTFKDNVATIDLKED